jgi:hypothetical protein
VRDRGPILDSQERAEAIAAWLRSTGLYELVQVERPAMATEVQLADASARLGGTLV